MFKDFKQLSEESKKVGLSRNEKADVQSALVSFMKNNPTQTPGGTHQHWRKRHFLGFYPPTLSRTAPAIFILILIFGGGVSFAAEGSLPGSVLYPIKVGVNEEVRAVLTLSEENKARWDAERAKRRLEEAEVLASRGKLDKQTAADINIRLETHTSETKKHIEKFRNEKKLEAAAEVSSDLESSLSTHTNILKKLAKKYAEDEEAHDIILSAGASAQDMADSRADFEDELSSKNENGAMKEAANSQFALSKRTIAEVKALLEKNKTALDSEAIAAATADIALAENMHAVGKSELDAGTYTNAFISFQKSVRIAKEAKVFLKARRTFKIRLGLDSLQRSNRGGDKTAETQINTGQNSTLSGELEPNESDEEDRSEIGITEQEETKNSADARHDDENEQEAEDSNTKKDDAHINGSVQGGTAMESSHTEFKTKENGELKLDLE